jgi:hypothetical protein
MFKKVNNRSIKIQGAINLNFDLIFKGAFAPFFLKITFLSLNLYGVEMCPSVEHADSINNYKENI